MLTVCHRQQTLVKYVCDMLGLCVWHVYNMSLAQWRIISLTRPMLSEKYKKAISSVSELNGKNKVQSETSRFGTHRPSDRSYTGGCGQRGKAGACSGMRCLGSRPTWQQWRLRTGWWVGHSIRWLNPPEEIQDELQYYIMRWKNWN